MDTFENEHGQKVVKLKHPSGSSCEVFLFGATITKFVTASGRDVIWVSSKAKLDGTKAIRGGIPLVFPQFGTPIKGMAQHGFARNAAWTLQGPDPTESAGEVSCLLSLDDKTATHEAWQHHYRLEYSVKLTAESLATSLTVHNVGEEQFEFMALQHTYINVGDISASKVVGLQGASYLDKTSENPDKAVTDESEAVTVSQFTDRVYTVQGGPIAEPVLVASPLGNISVSKRGSCTKPDGTAELPVDVVVWNPWAEKAASMADFEEGGHEKMLCVEPGLVSSFTVLPGQSSATLTQVLATAG